MQHNAAFYQGMHCSQNTSGAEIHRDLENSTYGLLKFIKNYGSINQNTETNNYFEYLFCIVAEIKAFKMIMKLLTK